MKMKNEIQSILSFLEDETSKGQIAEVEVEKHYAFDIMQFVKGLKYVITVEGDVIRNADNATQKAFFMLRNSLSYDHVMEVSKTLGFLLFSDAVKFGIDAVMETVAANYPSDDQLANYSRLKIKDELTTRYNEKREQVVKHISIKTGNKNIKSVKVDTLEGLAERLLKKKQMRKNPIYLITSGMGTGKTENVTVPAFELACELGLNPIGISPKRILASKIINDERNYQSATAAQQKGIFGVVDSMVSKAKFEQARQACKLLIVEEHEEVASQSAKKPTGDLSLMARANLVGDYYRMIKDVETVILIDAMFSTAEAEKLQKLTGRKIIEIKCDPKYKNNTVINLLKESEMIARAKNYLDDNKNILVFNDANNKGEKSKFNEIAHAIKLHSKSTNILTAKTISEMEDANAYMSNIEDHITKYQTTILSPVAPSGISFTNGHFDSAFTFINQVVSVKTAIQSLKRDRLLAENNVCINSNFSSNILYKEGVVFDELRKTETAVGLSEGYVKTMAANKDVDNVASIIVEENKMRADYEASLIIAMREMGFTINHDYDDEELGKQLRTDGKEAEEAERIESLISAEKISVERYLDLKDSDKQTTKDMYEVASFEMRDFYDVEELSQPLIEFDDKGDTRKVIKNNLVALSTTKAEDERKATNAIRKAVIDDIFNTLNIDATKMTGMFTKNEADALINKFENGEYRVQSMKVSGKAAFAAAFGSKLQKGHSMTVACSLLSAKFGIKTKHAGQKTIGGKRVNMKRVEFEAMDHILFDVIKTLAHNTPAYTPNVEFEDKVLSIHKKSLKDRIKESRLKKTIAANDVIDQAIIDEIEEMKKPVKVNVIKFEEPEVNYTVEEIAIIDELEKESEKLRKW